MKKYKFLREIDGKIKSNSGDCTWKVGEWQKEKEVDICNKGFHCSDTPLQAMGYVSGEILAEVEVKGKSQTRDDKSVWSEMKIVKAYKWEKKDSVSLSIFAAELVLENFEKKFPNDKRPRNAIEAAKKVLENDTEENRSAALLAAESARSAEWSAAESARSAAESAAESARSAELVARSARLAESAATKKLTTKIDKWFLERIKTLKQI